MAEEKRVIKIEVGSDLDMILMGIVVIFACLAWKGCEFLDKYEAERWPEETKEEME